MSELNIEGSEHAHAGGNKNIAILIAVLAALLALSETAGKSAQTEYLTQHIEASNLWAFFQAKTIRTTVVHTAMEATQALTGVAGAPGAPGAQVVAGATPPANDRIAAQMAAWQANVDRWESEPATREGRRELQARAAAAEHERERALATYHQFEVSSAAFQLAIVLASASIVTGVVLLAWVSGGLGLVGFAFSLLGWLAPTLVHL
jgi:hypothetical protein